MLNKRLSSGSSGGSGNASSSFAMIENGWFYSYMGPIYDPPSPCRLFPSTSPPSAAAKRRRCGGEVRRGLRWRRRAGIILNRFLLQDFLSSALKPKSGWRCACIRQMMLLESVTTWSTMLAALQLLLNHTAGAAVNVPSSPHATFITVWRGRFSSEMKLLLSGKQNKTMDWSWWRFRSIFWLNKRPEVHHKVLFFSKYNHYFTLDTQL